MKLISSLSLVITLVLVGCIFAKIEDAETRGMKKCLKVGSLTVCNDAAIGHNISVGGSETIANNLTVIGAVSAASLVITDSITAGGFDVSGGTVSGDLLVDGTLTVDGNTNLTSLNVLDNIVFEANNAKPLNAAGSISTPFTRMAWASLNANGSFISRSDIGASVTHSQGRYEISFQTGVFTTTPIVQVTTASGDTASYATTGTVTNEGAFISTFDSSGALTDMPFDVLAIGS